MTKGTHLLYTHSICWFDLYDALPPDVGDLPRLTDIPELNLAVMVVAASALDGYHARWAEEWVDEWLDWDGAGQALAQKYYYERRQLDARCN